MSSGGGGRGRGGGGRSRGDGGGGGRGGGDGAGRGGGGGGGGGGRFANERAPSGAGGRGVAGGGRFTNDRPPSSGGRGRGFGSDAYTIREELKISFTRQLMQLRENEVDKVTFPNNLSNIERKFIHKLSDELGLKSKSTGSGEDRAITVTKPEAAKAAAAAAAAAGGNGVQAAPPPPIYNMSPRTFDLLSNAFPDSAYLQTGVDWGKTGVARVSKDRVYRAPPLSVELNMIHSSYVDAQRRRDAKAEYVRMREKRRSLPAAAHEQNVCNLIKSHQVVLVSGETGCGKTTQVPQFLLDDPDIGPVSRICVTQPRRLSAISVAERIAAERCERIGETIGFNIRMESEKSRSTQVLFVTPGVLLRKLQSDPLLEEFSHIIIDEAHERDRFTEFLMIVLRDVCSRRASLKLVLMSATMHTNKLSSYFGGVPHIHIGGSVFPVQEFFLEHALRFTDHLGGSMAPPTASNATESAGKTFASIAKNQQVYNCVFCGFGPFKSSEELGTHCAMCTGPAPGQKMHTQQPKKASIQDLVSVLSKMTAAAAASSSGGGRKQFSYREGEEDFVDGADPEEAPEANTEGNDDDDDDDDEDPENKAQGVATLGEPAKSSDDAGSDDALLRNYQRQFDDTQTDYDLILALLRYIFRSEFCKEGSVLIFFSGWDDISRMHRLLMSTVDFNSRKFKVIQLHSGIPRQAQNAVFETLRAGEHKIILSTNIAETSVTIDDVAVVIDCGRMKEKQYDPYVKLAYLKSTWISRASARQRKGRAGRTRSGVCFHLFSKRRHAHLPEFQDSELLRMPLEELILQTKVLGIAPGMKDASDSVQAFLLKALDPPHILSISNAIQLLQSINCFDENEAITPLGEAIVRLPLDPRIGRILILGCLCGIGPATLATAAAMGYRDPFVMPTSDEQRALCNKVKFELANQMPSDQMALYRAMEGFKQSIQRQGMDSALAFCDSKFLSRSTMQYLRDLVTQLTATVKEIGVETTSPYAQRNNTNPALLMALVGIALYPDVGIRREGASNFLTEKGRKAKIHPGSLNSKNANYKGSCRRALEVVGYQDLVSSQANNAPGSASLLMLNTTPVSIFALLLTCGSFKEVDETATEDSEDEDDNGNDGEGRRGGRLDDMLHVLVDGWLPLRLPRHTFNILLACRTSLTNCMVRYVDQPTDALPSDEKRQIEALVQALTLEQADA